MRATRTALLKRRPHGLTRLLTIAALLLGLSLGAAAPAFAGHYFIEDVEVFPTGVPARLQALGIQTTEDVLMRVLVPQGRAQLAQQVGLTPEQMLEIARTTELLQIDGVGPKAARLLRLGGVTSVRDLASREAPELLVRLIEVNIEHQITGINPDLAVVTDWIERASRAEHHVR